MGGVIGLTLTACTTDSMVDDLGQQNEEGGSHTRLIALTTATQEMHMETAGKAELFGRVIIMPHRGTCGTEMFPENNHLIYLTTAIQNLHRPII